MFMNGAVGEDLHPAWCGHTGCDPTFIDVSHHTLTGFASTYSATTAGYQYRAQKREPRQ